MFLFRKFINEDKVHAKIQQAKAKGKVKKKSGFQKRLEEMAKQQGRQLPKK
jgi:YidC/Oxa1 family membrane protein insertase